MLKGESKMHRIEEIAWRETLPHYFKGVLHGGNPLEVAYVILDIPLVFIAVDMGLTEGQIRHYLRGTTAVPKKRSAAALSLLRKAIVGARNALNEVPQEYHGVTVFKEEIILLAARIRAAESYLERVTEIKTSDDQQLRDLYVKELRRLIRACSKTIDPKNWKHWPAGVPRPDEAAQKASNRKRAKVFKAELKKLEAK